MSHANARLTVHGRLLIVRRLRQGWTQAHIASAMGVSRKCVRYWLARYASEGEDGLADRSSRPHHSPTRTSPGGACAAAPEGVVAQGRERDRPPRDRCI